ncbi:MAG: DNA-3-methyladenine glycosylase [Planctomycetota bacterium]
MPPFPRERLEADPVTVARDLLGAVLSRRFEDGTRLRGRIVETEAYWGPQDQASHAKNGRRTPRIESMFAEPGTAYVYVSHGIHHCMNVSVTAAGTPEAVLIRALEPMEGLERMTALRAASRRPTSRALRVRDLCSGPGKLCRAMGIDLDGDGCNLLKTNALRLGSGGLRAGELVDAGPRIGLGSVGSWSEKPWRFFVRDSEHVSR